MSRAFTIALMVLSGGAVGLGLVYGSYLIGVNHGKTLQIAEQAAADMKAEMERKGDDATLQNLNQYNLCVLGLRGNGMPVTACDVLRGSGEE